MVSRLRRIAELAGYRVVAHTRFESAREELRADSPSISAIIANIRLAAFNGIHLVYLARLHRDDIRAVLYSRPHDPVLAVEVQRAGAFYQRQRFLQFSLPSFLRAGLPPNDRRAVVGIDRRTFFRGGRRSTDVGGLHFVPSAV